MKNRGIILLALTAVLVFGLALFFKNSSAGAQFVWAVSDNGRALLPLTVISSLVDSINPCAFSILLVSIVFLFSMGKSKEKVLLFGLLYVLGIFIAYLFIGLGILQALHIFNIPHFMGKLGVALLLLFGVLNILETIFPNFPIQFAVPHSVHGKMNELIKHVSFPAMFGLGLLVGLCEFPCTGGPYLTILGLLHDTKTYWQGTGYLLLYNIVFILPLVVILLIASNKDLIDKVQGFHKSNKRLMKLIGGVLMIILAFAILML